MNEPFYKGGIYHFFNRGCNRENIFFNQGNYFYLLKKMKERRDEYGVVILAYCLMPNHYHFLLRQETDRPLSDWMKRLFNGYVQAVNKQVGRSGTLFEGRTKHVLVNRDEYLMHLVRYIHLNPVKAGLVKRAEAWPFSNYPEWLGVRKGALVDREFIRGFFATADDYREFVEDGLAEREFAEELQKYYFD